MSFDLLVKLPPTETIAGDRRTPDGFKLICRDVSFDRAIETARFYAEGGYPVRIEPSGSDTEPDI